MAITFAASHTHPTHQAFGGTRAKAVANDKTRNKLAVFFNDLWEDVRERPLQAAHLAKHDMFREHINAMSICYFALILLLIAASLPVLAYLIGYQAL